MADPRGPVFVSYRRKRLRETTALVQALHDRGVPTWRDVDNLLNEPTEATIRAVLNDKNTSGAILWLTPDVKESPIIRDVEVPEAVRRYRRDSNFWIIIVLANRLKYADVSELFTDALGAEDLSTWNLTKVTAPWASTSDTSQIASTALRQRVNKIAEAAPSPQVSQVVVHAKGTMTAPSGEDLAVDWTRHFKDASPRFEDWATMSESAHDISAALKQLTRPATELHLSGTPSVPTAMLLGSTYSARDGRSPVWLQRQPDGHTMTPWRMSEAADASTAEKRGWEASAPVYRETSAHALAVCVNISDDVSEAFARSRSASPEWRMVLTIGAPAGRNTRAVPLAADEVASLVHLTVDAIRNVRSRVVGIDSIHFFIAGPAGFAFLLGTAIATLPPITTYEYDTSTALYVPAATFTS